MTRSKCLLLVFPLLLSGCYATSLMIGATEPDLTKIPLGGHRSQAEEVLGERLWRLGLDGGLTYDIYQYKATREAQPISGAFVLAVDSFALGLTEMQYWEQRKFFLVKQVCVAYDDRDFIRFVSQSWPVPDDTLGPCRRKRTLLPINSGIPLDARPSSAGTNQSDSASNLAIVEVDLNVSGTIDNLKIDKPRVFELPPGFHTFKDDYGIGFSFELFSGRLYRLKDYKVNRLLHLLYVEDVNSGETIQCYER